MSISVKTRIEELFPNLIKEIEELFDFEKIESYFKFLEIYNVQGGFFSKADSENILDRHLIESILHIHHILKQIPISANTKVADIGTGPGLPGYLFFSLKNFPTITLVDSQRRRLSFLESFHKQTYPNSKVSFIYERVESIKEKFDIVLMRSTIKYPWSAEMIAKLLRVNSIFIPFLGKRSYDLNFEGQILENLGLKIEKEINLNELEFLGMRHIKLLKKIAEPMKGYPRAWEIVSKEIKRTSWEK